MGRVPGLAPRAGTKSGGLVGMGGLRGLGCLTAWPVACARGPVSGFGGASGIYPTVTGNAPRPTCATRKHVLFNFAVGGRGFVRWDILGVIGFGFLIARRPVGDDDNPLVSLGRPLLDAVEALL